jgi:hypothetical protein
MEYEEIVLKKYNAANGYVFKHKESGNILSEVLYLGINDSIENYEEVLKNE